MDPHQIFSYLSVGIDEILEGISDGIFILNEKGKFVFVNKVIEERAGIPLEQFLKFHFTDILPEEFKPKAKKYFDDIFAGKNIPLEEFDYRTADGSLRTIELRGRKITSPGGVPLSLFTARNITERRNVEEALRQSEERYRYLAENIMIGLFISDRETGKFLYVNKTLLSMFGYTIEESREMSIWDVIHPGEHATVIERLTKRLRGEIKPDSTHIYTGIRKDGTTLKIEVSVTPFTMKSQSIVQGIIRDVTELESLHQQLLHAQKMKAIGTLAGGIAHDFNNILMGIQGNISLIKMELEKDDPTKEMADNIQNLIQQAASLTRQLLGFSRGGKQEATIKNINDIISNSALIFGRTHKEIILQMNLHENLWHAKVDSGQIDQVLLNILVNAWQAMPSGGTITIESSNTLLSDTLAPAGIAAGKYVKISITDTGIGMDEETKQRIFDPFFTTKEMGRGVGLGLTSAYGIVKEHGGFIDVQSKPGEGSTFTVYLPASDETPATLTKTADDIHSGEGTVLIIDDETPVLTVTAKMLQKLGYDTLTASNGSEAVRLVQSGSPPIDCIILDMIMPGTNPKELMAEIRKFRKNVPVILASGYSLEGEVKEVLSMGCAAFLQKPFKLEELSMAVKKAVSSIS